MKPLTNEEKILVGTLLAVTRIIDKLFRIATDEKAFSEDPWADIAGYAILMVGQENED
jgi:hypothetical protein